MSPNILRLPQNPRLLNSAARNPLLTFDFEQSEIKRGFKHRLAEEFAVGWKVRAIRGATTASENTTEAITEAVTELLDRLEQHNQLDPEEIISVVFTTTKDLDAIFPAAIARHRPFWDNIALLDVQQMHVEKDLERCIRVLIHLNVPSPDLKLTNVYLRHAQNLRPDWSLSSRS